MNEDRKITSVYTFPNGMCMVFDQFGEQMPEYQGLSDEMVPKIRASGYAGEALVLLGALFHG